MLSFARQLRQMQPGIRAALENALLQVPDSLREVASYAAMGEGKRLRPMLVLVSARLFGKDDQTVYPLAAALELIHVASLLHDDIMDNADTRRGRKAAHLVFGVLPALLAGDALMALAGRIVGSYGDSELVDCVSDGILSTVAGQAREFALKNKLIDDPLLSMEQYLDVITGKTSRLIRAAARAGALCAGASPEGLNALSDYALNLGIAFQMVDDALDFADAAVTGKPAGGDLREGKLTPPIALYYQSLSAADQKTFAGHFTAGSFSDAQIDAIVRSVREQGLAGQARALADTYLRSAGESLALLPASPQRDTLRQALAYVRDREG
jgi:octaprenyl-diphosphate synthase